MRKRIFAFTAALLVQTAFAGNTILTSADNGRTIPLIIGQCLDVRLASQAASTGYQWYLAPGLSEALSLTARTITTPGDAIPGTPVTLDYILCAASPGEAVVKFENYRPWEKNTKPAQMLNFTVKVSR